MSKTETIGEFFIKLGLDADGIDEKINNVISNIGNSLNSLVTGIIAPALAGLASADFVKQFADEMTQVDKLSQSLNISVESLSAWRQAAEMAGIEANEVGELFADMNDWMTDVKYDESGTLYDYIQYGILPSVMDANGEMKKTEDYILEIADAFHKMDTAEASGIARKLGISDINTASWMQQGGDAIREQLELAKQIGTYTEEDTKAAKDFTMAITILTNSLKMAALPLFRFLVPILTQISKIFSELSSRIKNLVPQFGNMGDTGKTVANKIAQAFETISNHATALIPVLGGLITMIGVKLVKALSTALSTFKFSPWGAVLTALTGIGIIIEDFIKWLNGEESNFSGFFTKIFGDADNAKSILEDIYNFFLNIIENLSNSLNELTPQFMALWEAVKNLFTSIAGSEGFELFTSAFIKIVGFIFSVVASLVNFLAENGSIITDIIATVIDVITGIVDVITFVVETINTGITSIIEIFTAFGNVIQQIGSIVEMIFNAMAGAFNSFVGAVVSGAEAVISAISGILSKLAELASNSLIGKVLGSIGGSISAVIGGGGSYSTDNSSTYYNINQTNNFKNPVPKGFEIPDLVPKNIGAFQ